MWLDYWGCFPKRGVLILPTGWEAIVAWGPKAGAVSSRHLHFSWVAAWVSTNV